VHARLLLGHGKKIARQRKAGEEKEFILSSVFHARKSDESNVSRTQSRMENQCVDSEKKRRKNREQREKELFSSFKYLYIERRHSSIYLCVYKDAYFR
jgi:hypothetical protein